MVTQNDFAKRVFNTLGNVFHTKVCKTLLHFIASCEGGCTVRPCEERKEGKGEGGSRPRRTPEHRRKARHVAACRPTDGRTDGAVKREAAVSRRGGQIRQQARQGRAF